MTVENRPPMPGMRPPVGSGGLSGRYRSLRTPGSRRLEALGVEGLRGDRRAQIRSRLDGHRLAALRDAGGDLEAIGPVLRAAALEGLQDLLADAHLDAHRPRAAHQLVSDPQRALRAAAEHRARQLVRLERPAVGALVEVLRRHESAVDATEGDAAVVDEP